MASVKNSWFSLEKLTIIILLIILFLLQQCHKSCPKEPWEVTHTIVKTYRDTVVTVRIDTVVKYASLEIPEPIPSFEDSTISIYTQEYNDSNLDASFITGIDGVLVSSDFKYRLKVPKEILTTITQVDTVTKTVKQNKNILAIGGLLMGSNDTFDAAIGLSFYHKKGYLYQLNYAPISRTVLVGFSYQLNK